jgi:uncharacterized membrane protein YjgN (DUF898 family)
MAAFSSTYQVRWKGSGYQYFGIWIVNTALTLLTLGIYLPWAKIRNRRYFYAHTEFAGHSFEYHARPLSVLLGYAIVLGALVCFNASQFIHPGLFVVAVLLLFAIWPWLYFKALRFRFNNSSYRGIRFRFEGSLEESYRINLIWMLLIPVTGGMIYPYIDYRRKHYLFGNLRLGKTGFLLKGELSRFFVIYAIAYGIIILLYALVIIAVIVVIALVIGVSGMGEYPDLQNWMAGLTLGGFMLGYATFLLLLFVLHVYVSTEILKHCLNRLAMDNGIRFESNLEFWELLKIRLINVFLSLITLGIYSPWAAVRVHAYLVDHIKVQVPDGALECLKGALSGEQAALGDAGADVFDFDIGF